MLGANLYFYVSCRKEIPCNAENNFPSGSRERDPQYTMSWRHKYPFILNILKLMSMLQKQGIPNYDLEKNSGLDF